jgi:hypothetical protein
MRLALKLHPDSASSVINGIEVEVARSRGGELALSYLVAGKMNGLLLPQVVAPARTDELWRHTCFEAFLGFSPGAGYYEFNFSPSTQWAAYRFSNYRSGMQIAPEIDTPRIEASSSPENYILRVTLDLKRINMPDSDRWRLGLSVVTEETNGDKSYWALAHAQGKPDFHRYDCFTHEFP